MTKEYREYAKSRIEYLLKISSFVFDERDKEALEAAIQALSQEPTDAVSRILNRMWNCRGKHTTSIDKVAMEQIIRDELPSVTQKPIECDDAISREAVLLFIEKVKESGIINYGSLLDIATEVRNLPSVTQKSGKWIPVGERLPEKYGEYLITWTGVCGKQRSKPLIGIAEYEIYEPENYEDWITTDNEFRHYHDIKVLAWQELPEPYEPQESEDKE